MWPIIYYVSVDLVFCDNNLEDGMEVGKEAQEGGDICILMADSDCCMAEVSTIVKQLSSN